MQKEWRMYDEIEGCPECGSIPEVLTIGKPAEGDSVRCPECDTRGSVEADGRIWWG